MKEKIIISLTSWRQRLSNLPAVLKSIADQTVKPDAIVLNLSREELDGALPDGLRETLDKYGVTVNWVEKDTKVWKKFIPTFDLYPNDAIIAIDDDFIYPPYMVEDFMSAHGKHPDSPISGNRYWRAGVKCHCGCASLIKKEYFGDFLKYVDGDMIKNCVSSDIFYTRMAAANGRFYVETKNEYSTNMRRIDNGSPEYSKTVNRNCVKNSSKYIFSRLGYEVTRYEAGKNRPICVLGTMHNALGLAIAREMKEWLQRIYEVHEVVHDGTRYEYPALSYAQRVSLTYGVPVLYLHTKGAFNKPYRSLLIRRMWKQQFGDGNYRKYISLVSDSKPVVATPFTGPDRMTRYNGFMANPAAWSAIGTIAPSDDRMVFEKLFRGEKVSIIGTVYDNITSERLSVMHDYLKRNYS